MTPATTASSASPAAQVQAAHSLPLIQLLLRALASLPLAICLIVLLAAVLAGATIVETYLGADSARWYFYDAGWFAALLAVMAVNVVGAAIVRFPWQRHQTGFVVTHFGLLVLLIGAAVSRSGSLEGRVTLVEGETATDMVLAGRSRITAFAVGDSSERPYEFSFVPRPDDWDSLSPLAAGTVDGVAVDILALVHQPRLQIRWVRDESEIGGPAIRFQVTEAAGRQIAESWLVDQRFGESGNIGPLRMQLERAVNDGMLADFEHPPTDGLGEHGLLFAYCGDDAERIPVDGNIGREFPVGDDGIRVEIAEYLPHAQPDRLGRFTSLDDRPANPLLEIRVSTPDADDPLRQVASAKDPLLNLDGVYGRSCPVAFRYLHPAVVSPIDVALLQTGDGKLHARTTTNGRFTLARDVALGNTLAVAGGFQLTVLDYLPYARRDISFESMLHNPRGPRADASEQAALVQLTVAGEQHQVWMRRNDPLYGRRVVATHAGKWALEFDHARAPLGFNLQLVDFSRQPNPGNVGNAAFLSRVRIRDEAHGVDREHVVSMNQPLSYQGQTFYQLDYEESDHGRDASTFTVNADPGRTLKYAGSLLVCCGIAIMFYMRAYFFGRDSDTDSPTISSREPTRTTTPSDNRALDAEPPCPR